MEAIMERSPADQHHRQLLDANLPPDAWFLLPCARGRGYFRVQREKRSDSVRIQSASGDRLARRSRGGTVVISARDNSCMETISPCLIVPLARSPMLPDKRPLREESLYPTLKIVPRPIGGSGGPTALDAWTVQPMMVDWREASER
jgi:hypothetical protein